MTARVKLLPDIILKSRWNVAGFILGFLTLPVLWWMLSLLDDETARMKRFYEAEAQSVLGGLYWTCRMYWDDHDPEDACDRDAVTGPEYPFEPADQVEFELKGNATTFRATARHLGDPQNTVWSIDADGNIHGGPGGG